ncbi:MAG: DVU0298 family protein [Desulfobaccales bacterium]
MVNQRTLREQLRKLLREADYPEALALAAADGRVGEILLQFLYDPRDLLHWRALETLGRLAGAQPRSVQKLISRLLWLLNEDSGSFGWGAAAALGEIGRQQISLVSEIIPRFVGLLNEEFSRAPMLWGIGRLAERHPELLSEVLPAVVPLLTSTEAQIRALAAWALGKAGYCQAAAALQALTHDENPVTIYDRAELRQITVGQVAREALASLKGQGASGAVFTG